jgi:glycerate kinase
VITGEGALDETSFAGKVVGGIVSIAGDDGIPVLAVVGDADRVTVDRRRNDLDVISLVEAVGAATAFAEPKRCIEDAVASWLREHAM